MNIFKKSLVAAVATGFVVAGSGFAAPVVALEKGAVQQVGNPANIDANAKASLTIHKHPTPAGDRKAGNGLEDTSVTSDGLAGAKFKITKVKGINLTTNEGWKAASQLTVETAA